MMAKLIEIGPFPFRPVERPPDIPTGMYRNRLAALRERIRNADLDFIVVYADREHCGNLAYLTGFDPRFEEALLVISRDGNRTLLFGNECAGYLPDMEGLEIAPVLFQEFSLMGQPRSASKSLRSAFSELGIRSGSKVGCAGWKYFGDGLIENPTYAIEIPAYLVDLLREMTTSKENVWNANAILMDPESGLRSINEPEQIAWFEYAASLTAQGIMNVLLSLQPGVSEDELEHLMDSKGLPLSCHRMVSFGEKTKRGLSSASGNKASLGDAFTTAFGVNGSLASRAGYVAKDANDLPTAIRDFYPKMASNYYDVIVKWYETIAVGATAGDVFDAVDAVRNPERFDFALNPGHQIHLDEWMNSPFKAGSRAVLKSGMALQADIIPVSKGPWCFINDEDGVVLADSGLRATLKAKFPDAWERIEARRAFMKDTLGIGIDDSVLPLSDCQAVLAPFGLSHTRVFANQ
jgi:hypothetical protein